ncbi:MAG: hypothetical protein AAGJ84_05690 [Pseudomonadota bacterium]
MAGLRNLSADEIENAGCDHFDTNVCHGQARTVKPCVYCGGILAAGGTVKLKPGEYIIKDGSLSVLLRGHLMGENVVFFLTGKLTTILFTGCTIIEVSVLEKGIMAGMLFFEDPQSPTSIYHTIASNNARRLVGKVYIYPSRNC